MKLKFYFRTIVSGFLIGIMNSCSMDTGCEQRSTYTQVLGKVTLDKSNKQFLFPDTLKAIRFRSSNGFLANYSIDADTGINSKQASFIRNNGSNCLPDTEVTYFSIIDNYTLSSVQIPLVIRIHRYRLVSNGAINNLTPATLQNANEVISFSLSGDQALQFVIKDSALSYLPDVTIGGKNYKDLYEGKPPQIASSQGNYPVKFYLKKGEGLVAFILSSNESWVKE